MSEPMHYTDGPGSDTAISRERGTLTRGSSPGRETVSFRRGDNIALAAGILLTLLLLGYLGWASARNFSRDRAITASEVTHTH